MIQRYPCSACRFGAHFPVLFVAIFGFVTWSVFSQDGPKPDDSWYRAFMTFKSAQDFEARGNYLEALNKCNEAKALYDGLAFQFPEFQPEIVGYKRKVVADARLRIKDAMSRRAKGGTSVAPRPAPRPRQEIPRYGDLPNVQTPGSSHRHETMGETQIAPPPESTPGSNVLPSWDSRSISTEILNDAHRVQQRRDSEIDWLNKENQRLKAERDSFEAKLQNVQRELSQSRQRQYEYKQRINEFESDPNNQGSVQKARQYKALLDDTMAELQASTDLNSKLVKQLRAARQKIKLQDEQIRQLQSERDSLVDIINGKGLGTKALRDLMDQNRKLTQRLDLAEKVAMNAAKDSEQRERDIDLLKSEIAKVKIERDRLVDDNLKHQVEIEGLHKKLEMLSTGVTEEEKRNIANISPEQQAENELLRSMVLKQLRRHAQLKQAKELLLRQLDRVGARSSVLMEVVEDMARGPQLSPEEKALFRSPQVAEVLEAVYPPESETGGHDPNKSRNNLYAPGAGAERGTTVKGQKIEVELSQLDKAARLDFQEGRYAEAEQGFLRYLHYRPRSVPCLCNLGVLKLAVRNYTEAQQYLQKAIALDQKSGLAFYLLGRTYFLQEKYEEALSHLEQGIQLEPNNAKAHNCVGVIASRNGWVTRAERAFVRAVDIEPKYGDAHFNLAVLFSSHDRPNATRAGEHYFRALDLGVPRDASIEKFLKQAMPIEVGLR